MPARGRLVGPRAVAAVVSATTGLRQLIGRASRANFRGLPTDSRLILDQLLADGVDITDQAALDTWIAAYGTRFAGTAG